MLPITGYADRLSVAPGETIEFKISCTGEGSFDAHLVRVICGDINPDGPGIREERIESPFDDTYPARLQPVHLGSYAKIEHSPALGDLESFTASATIWPTTPDKPRQGIITKLDPITGQGFAVLLDGERGITLELGGRALGVEKKLRVRTWYRVWASYDANSQTARVGQQPLMPAYLIDDAGENTARIDDPPALNNDGPLILAARSATRIEGHYNGKLESPSLLSEALTEAAPGAAAELPNSVIAAWDFCQAISSDRIIDVGPNALHGELINLPARGMMGAHWSGDEMCWRHAPGQYGAIHFHDDDIYDCAWETDFRFTVPADLRSGVYAARLIQGEGEDMIPFFVRPARGTVQSDVCVLVPTFTYVIYANHARGNTNAKTRERLASWRARPWTPDDHPDYGLSTYNVHSDGSGICHSSRLRPILTMRSAFVSIPELPGSSTRHFPATPICLIGCKRWVMTSMW